MMQPHLDKTVIQPTRLAIMAHLAAFGGEAPFAAVRAAAGGPSHSLLWSHSQILARAGYITVRKRIDGRQVHTFLALTDLGRQVFLAHKAALSPAAEHVA